MLAGEETSADAFGTKDRPVTTPPAPRLTSAVACCHQGLLAEGNKPTSFLNARATAIPGKRSAAHGENVEFGKFLRMAWTRGLPGSLAF